ncbi:hypothetical protein B0H15DRAFT_770072 [Mycena belliarum]|uniref:Uncharacterized protein n=1 Tax=Mycena belliarum TaxID=1033014 RepID=A0AAD6UH05_9AGAR|nr:hypothetical protein B0H15DRAFT_770072 [Mycena belliae]
MPPAHRHTRVRGVLCARLAVVAVAILGPASNACRHRRQCGLCAELDAYRNRVNNTARRADKNKILPHGVPNHMYEAPEDFGVLDFKIKVDPESISHVRNLYAPPDHEVFELVPKAFADLAVEFYIEMGQPSVTRTNVWDIYMEILTQFLHLDNAHRVPVALDEKWGYALTMARDDYQDDIDLIPNLVPLRNGEADVVGQDGTFYMGGVNNGGGLGGPSFYDLQLILIAKGQMIHTYCSSTR